jgi:hypothetical protein
MVWTRKSMEEVVMTASTVAIPTRSHRGGFALLLALLGVPGVTIAWDLPAGGFWIGIPLAVAAIVVGVGARRAGSRLAIAAIALAAVEIVFTASWTVLG